MKSTIIQRELLTDGSTQFIAAYHDSKQASAASGVPYSSVRYSIRGEQFGKMKFTQQDRKAIHNATRGKMRVTQRDANGEVIAVYANMRTAAKLTNISVSNIRKVINADKSISGYTFNG